MEIALRSGAGRSKRCCGVQWQVQMRKLLLLCLLLLPSLVTAQEAKDTPRRMLLEAGIVGGKSPACPGHYVGLEGRVAGPVSLYGMVENYRCIDLAGSANRLGASVLLGRESWFVRPSLRTGIEYDGGDVSPTVAANLTFGHRYGARFSVHRGDETAAGVLVLFQLGGYITF